MKNSGGRYWDRYVDMSNLHIYIVETPTCSDITRMGSSFKGFDPKICRKCMKFTVSAFSLALVT